MVRSLIGILALGCVCVASSAGDVVKQPEQQPPAAERIATSPSGPSQIDGMVTKIREAETAHAPAAAMAQLYESLSSGFAKLGAYPQAQGALRQASALLRNGSARELAQVLGQLAILDVAVGDVRHAVKIDPPARVRSSSSSSAAPSPTRSICPCDRTCRGLGYRTVRSPVA